MYAKICVVSKFGNSSKFVSNFGHKKYIIWGFGARSTSTAHDKHSFKCLVLRKHLNRPNFSMENFASKGFNAQQTACAIKYKSHCCVGLATELIRLMEAQMGLTKVPKHF